MSRNAPVLLEYERVINFDNFFLTAGQIIHLLKHEYPEKKGDFLIVENMLDESTSVVKIYALGLPLPDSDLNIALCFSVVDVGGYDVIDDLSENLKKCHALVVSTRIEVSFVGISDVNTVWEFAFGKIESIFQFISNPESIEDYFDL